MKKSITYQISVLLITLLMASSQVLFGSSFYSIPFENINGLMLIEADFDGQQGHFIFDTGADEILLHSEEKIKGNTVFETVGGELTTKKDRINYLRIGKYKEEDVTVYKTDLQSLRRYTGTQISGIVGLSVFDVEVLYIDNVNNLIQLSSLEYIDTLSDRKFIRNNMTLDGKLPMMNVKIGDTDYQFVIDSGATTSYICQSIIEVQGDQFNQLDSTFNLTTATTEVTEANYYTCDAITLGKLKLRNLTFGGGDFSEDEGISGILSIDSLPNEVIIFDFVTRHIYLSI